VKRHIVRSVFIPMAVGLVLIGRMVHAAPLSFTESGDFSGNLGSPFIIAQPLDVGINTISGSLPANFLADVDVFQVSVPTSLLVGSIQIDVTNYVGVQGDNGRFEILLPNLGAVDFAADGLFSLSAIFNDPGTLKFRVLAPEVLSPPATGSYNYTVRISASPVPEPSTFLLMGAGILGPLGSVWRKQVRRKKMGSVLHTRIRR
jgi:hypothetical protein